MSDAARRITADVVVCGAGPGGAAAATVLARGGARVLLVDRAVFPREKICGDGLLPDALEALAELGLSPTGLAPAVSALRLVTSSGRWLRVPVSARVVRRRDLDAAVLAGALTAGAELVTGAELAGFDADGAGFRVARLATPAGPILAEAGAFVLATGAAQRPRAMAGLTARRRERAVAVRGYVAGAELPADEMRVSLLADLPLGYAWAFPLPDGAWNLGCGVMAGRTGAPPLTRVAERYRALCGGGGWLSPPRGAPLLTFHPSGPAGRANLAAVGDAAGLTRPFSGEGIGPALASGALAARCLLAEPGVAGVARYRRELRARYAGDFAAWRFGARLLRLSWLVDAAVGRAARFPGALRRLSGVLGGTISAQRVLSPLGLVRLALGR